MMDDLDIDVGVTSISEPGTMPLKKKHAAKVARKVNEYQAQLKEIIQVALKVLHYFQCPM